MEISKDIFFLVAPINAFLPFTEEYKKAISTSVSLISCNAIFRSSLDELISTSPM